MKWTKILLPMLLVTSNLVLAETLGIATKSLSNELTVEELVDRIDNLYRLDSSHATITMEIQTPDWQRSMTMEMWTKGQDYALIRILAPRKEKGVATLKRGNEMWNYFPKINKEIKIPPSMMMGSWMGSDFTNDDLVREVSLLEEYDAELETQDSGYKLTLIPKEQTVTVWGKIIIDIEPQHLLPTKERYFDEDGTPMREMRFLELTDFDGLILPRVMELVPLNKDNQKTTLVYDNLVFNQSPDDKLFTLINLKRMR